MTSAVEQGVAAQWRAAQEWERAWWLANSARHAEEIYKSDIVANWLLIGDVSTKSVLDIGCGPFSLLQRRPAGRGVAVDPIDYGPLEERYRELGIRRVIAKGEDLTPALVGHFSEAWIYNCLQHVENPELVLRNAIQLADRVRVFEWINIPPYEGHLHMLTAEGLVRPFQETGWTDELTIVGVSKTEGLHGTFFAGVFAPRS